MKLSVGFIVSEVLIVKGGYGVPVPPTTTTPNKQSLTRNYIPKPYTKLSLPKKFDSMTP